MHVRQYISAASPLPRSRGWAATGGADAVVSGDKAIPGLESFRKAKLPSLRAYLGEIP